MDPITAIALAKGIASATGLDDWITSKLGGVVGASTAGKIIDVAKVATGASSPEQALKQLQGSSESAAKARIKLLNHEHELSLAALADTQSARQMYSDKSHMADKVAAQVIAQNHWVVALLITANAAVLYFVDDKAVALALGNLIGISINALWSERQQVVGFFFGSSLGSKLKNNELFKPK